MRVAPGYPVHPHSQPWRWVADHAGLHLYEDLDGLVYADQAEREALISCGAVLDHLRVAMDYVAHG